MKKLIVLMALALATTASALPSPQEVRRDIIAVCHAERIHPGLLLGIASRESDFGLTLDSAWKGDKGFGYGVFQIDSRHHAAWLKSNNWRCTKTSCRYAIKLLRANLREFGNINEAIAAYNCGPKNVSRSLKAGTGIDGRTTGRDYSRDVFHRARKEWK